MFLAAAWLPSPSSSPAGRLFTCLWLGHARFPRPPAPSSLSLCTYVHTPNHKSYPCRERAANESWLPPPIPASASSVAGFPGEEAFEAAMFLSECSARFGFVDRDVQRECPFLLQVPM